MSTIRTTQPKRKLNLSMITERVLSSADPSSMWGVEASHSRQTSNGGGGGGSHTSPIPAGSNTGPIAPGGSHTSPAPLNPPPPQRDDGAA